MRKADLGNRFVAFIIDYFVMQFVSGIIITPLTFILIFPILFIGNDASMNAIVILFLCFGVLALIVAALAISYFYYIWLPVTKWNGATLGKRAMKLRVVKIDGTEVGQMDLFLREIVGKFVSGALFYLGYIWIFIDEKGQGWHDMLAGTWVVEDEKLYKSNSKF